MITTCKSCGLEFETTHSKAKFCNRECYWDDRGRSKPLTCIECKREFKNVDHPDAKFCSRECVISNQRANKRDPMPEPLHVCVSCGKEFRRYGRTRKYCSQQCYHDAPKEVLRRKKHVKSPADLKENYPKGWDKLKQTILERDNRTCQKCFVVCEGKGNACVHHIIGRKHNELHQLTTLCRACHTQITVIEQALKLLAKFGKETYAPFIYDLGEYNG